MKERAWITEKKIASNYNEKDDMNNSEIERMNYKEKWALINVKKRAWSSEKETTAKKKRILVTAKQRAWIAVNKKSWCT